MSEAQSINSNTHSQKMVEIPFCYGAFKVKFLAVCVSCVKTATQKHQMQRFWRLLSHFILSFIPLGGAAWAPSCLTLSGGDRSSPKGAVEHLVGCLILPDRLP